MMHLPDKTEVIVDVETSTITGMTYYIIRDKDAFDEIDGHPYQEFLEDYFQSHLQNCLGKK